MEHYSKDLNQADLRYKLKHVFCNDPSCWICAQGKGHGPYWHATYEEKGQTQTVFLGKEFRPLDLASDSEAEKSSTNRTENRFHYEPKTPPRTISVDKKRFMKTTAENKDPVDTPPTRFDFERDLNTLKNTFRADSLKSVYRRLTKKYHPDKFPGIGHINTWMAEINGQYSQKKKTVRL